MVISWQLWGLFGCYMIHTAVTRSTRRCNGGITQTVCLIAIFCGLVSLRKMTNCTLGYQEKSAILFNYLFYFSGLYLCKVQNIFVQCTINVHKALIVHKLHTSKSLEALKTVNHNGFLTICSLWMTKLFYKILLLADAKWRHTTGTPGYCVLHEIQYFRTITATFKTLNTMFCSKVTLWNGVSNSISIPCVPENRKPDLSVRYLYCHAIVNQTTLCFIIKGIFSSFIWYQTHDDISMHDWKGTI